MAPSWFSPRLVFAALSLLLALQSNSLPTTPGNPDSLMMDNSSANAVINHCYTPNGQETPGIKPTNLQACKDALNLLVHTPDFTTEFRFSRNPRAMAKQLPIGWQVNYYSDCRILVSCENDRDTAVFRYADVAQAAKRVISACVDNPDPHGRLPMLKWGGVASLKNEDTFYVAIAKPIRPELEIEVANRTVITGGGLVNGAIELS